MSLSVALNIASINVIDIKVIMTPSSDSILRNMSTFPL